MDPEVARLVRAQRLLEAAELASDRGDAHTASRIYEQACAWSRSAVEALRAGDAARALRLAVYGGDEATAESALTLVIRDGPAAAAAAAQLAHQGRHGWAARILEASGRALEAATLWEQAGEARRAASAFARGGQPTEAARVLHAKLAREPHRGDLALDLGGLLGRLGRWHAAARTLQRVSANSPERAAALVALIPALVHLGLPRAAAHARKELAAHSDASTATAGPPLCAPSSSANVYGRYALVREVASSPHARLLECRDTVLGEHVAVKIFVADVESTAARDARSRFEHEVLVAQSLHHPAIVPLREYLPQGPATATAWMTGGNLEAVSSAFGPLAPARAVEIACAVLGALGAAHRLGVIHGRVKPANVLFDAAGGARLCDSGSAQMSDMSATATSGLARALAYVAPEQREGRNATEWSDVFSVGAMLREMLTGESPDPFGTLQVWPSQTRLGLDASHDRVVSQMTARDPDGRPSALEAIARLVELPWPRTRPGPGAAGAERGGRSPVAERLARAADGAPVDTWIGRTIAQAPGTPRNLALARAFAQAGDEALQAIRGADESSGTIWLERLGDVAVDRALHEHERARLRKALEALHGQGAVHGRVDRSHILQTARGLVLSFDPGPEDAATAAQDVDALATL